MNAGLTAWNEEIPALLRGETATARVILERPATRQWLLFSAAILLGAALFGAAIGSWSSSRQAFYAAIKLPLILFLTALGNGLLNAMLAPLLGVNLSPRQSLFAVLTSFALAAAILGAFSPLLAFVIWNTPEPGAAREMALAGHSLVLVTQTGMIALSGFAANLRLWQMLREVSGNARAARRVLFFWLGGNFLLGSQLSWIFRPIVGSPHLPTQFLRDHPMQGSFYESIFGALRHLFIP